MQVPHSKLVRLRVTLPSLARRSATTFSPGVSTAILPLVQDLDPQTNIQDQRQAPGGGTRHSLLPVSRAYDPSIPGGQLGILRVVIIDGPAIPHYVWRGPTITTEYVSKAYPSYLRATIDRHEALVVCFKPSPEPHLIGCLVTNFHICVT